MFQRTLSQVEQNYWGKHFEYSVNVQEKWEDNTTDHVDGYNKHKPLNHKAHRGGRIILLEKYRAESKSGFRCHKLEGLQRGLKWYFAIIAIFAAV